MRHRHRRHATRQTPAARGTSGAGGGVAAIIIILVCCGLLSKKHDDAAAPKAPLDSPEPRRVRPAPPMADARPAKDLQISQPTTDPAEMAAAVERERLQRAAAADGGKTEHVGGYYRKDGTYVHAYNRHPSH